MDSKFQNHTGNRAKMENEEITRLRIRKTVMHMLRDRGHMMADVEVEMTRTQFVQKYGENMKREDLMIIKGIRNNSDQIYVFFPDEAKVGVKTMKTYTNRMKEDNVNRATLVVQQSLTPFA